MAPDPIKLLFAISKVTGCVILTATIGHAQIQCVTCHDFNASSSGWSSSPNPGACGDQCQNIQDQACRQNCNNSVAPVADLSPGIFVEEKLGKLWVKSVIPGSSADAAGIRPADEIVRINGRVPGQKCLAGTWSSEESPKTSVITISNKGTERTVRVGLLPIRTVVANLWLPRTVQQSPDAFTLGFMWRSTPDGLVVTNVLDGSAAASAGVHPGDLILSADSSSIESLAESIRPRSERYSAVLDIEHQGKRKQVPLYASSVFEAANTMAADLHEVSGK